MSDRISISIHSSTSHLTGRRRTYESVKAAVIKAGRFSVFEACDSSNLFMRLESDLEIETFKLGFPWTGARRRLTAEEAQMSERLKRIEAILVALEHRVKRREYNCIKAAFENAHDDDALVVFSSNPIRDSEATRWRRWAAVIEKERGEL